MLLKMPSHNLNSELVGGLGTQLGNFKFEVQSLSPLKYHSTFCCRILCTTLFYQSVSLGPLHHQGIHLPRNVAKCPKDPSKDQEPLLYLASHHTKPSNLLPMHAPIAVPSSPSFHFFQTQECRLGRDAEGSIEHKTTIDEG